MSYDCAPNIGLRVYQFNQTVKIRAIAIQCSDIPRAPKLIRLLINRPSLNFEDVEDENSSIQQIELTEDQVREGKRIELRFVRFQSVTSLHVSRPSALQACEADDHPTT